MIQEDLIINKIPVVVNTDPDGDWRNNKVTILKPDATEDDAIFIMSYLFEEGFIIDRRTTWEIK
tara:strand:- start:194 stop:385 length:192 start_codon:yes stop_codon:yes gene_type:complete